MLYVPTGESFERVDAVAVGKSRRFAGVRNAISVGVDEHFHAGEAPFVGVFDGVGVEINKGGPGDDCANSGRGRRGTGGGRTGGGETGVWRLPKILSIACWPATTLRRNTRPRARLRPSLLDDFAHTVAARGQALEGVVAGGVSGGSRFVLVKLAILVGVDVSGPSNLGLLAIVLNAICIDVIEDTAADDADRGGGSVAKVLIAVLPVGDSHVDVRPQAG